MRCGLFFGGHQAVHDCEATLEMLARPLPRCVQTALARLLNGARQASWRIWAAEAPFERKNRLKARGYRWNGEATERNPRAWYRDVAEADHAAELAFLQAEIYGRTMDLPMRRITAHDRYSERA
jgi:DNA polymerase-3 subunit epsilon